MSYLSNLDSLIFSSSEHINHIRDLIGVDFMGFGADYDGVGDLPVGLEDVTSYPQILARLVKFHNYSIEDIKKIAGNVYDQFQIDTLTIPGTLNCQRVVPVSKLVCLVWPCVLTRVGSIPTSPFTISEF